jgi:hypothetical protein
MDFSMTAEAIGATVTGTGVLGGIVMYVVRAEFAKFSLAIKDTMALQQRETREWVNGSFMRAATVGAQLDAQGDKIENIAERVDEIEKKLDGHVQQTAARRTS